MNSPALEAMRHRRSYSKVGDSAPNDAELATLVATAGRVADHAALRPWRLITLRGDDRERLGAALGQAAGDDKPSVKPLRAPLLIAIVVSYQPSEKVPHWEQDAVASGVAHALELLLDEAGWGVIWRTGELTRHPIVAEAHGLQPNEQLLGWLYVGSKPERESVKAPKLIDPASVLTTMPAGGEGTPVQQPPVPGKKAAKKQAKNRKAVQKPAPTEAELERKRLKKARKHRKKQLKKQHKKQIKAALREEFGG